MSAEHEFTLILEGISDLTPDVMNALYEAGCDDATISRQDGVVSMDFDRAADSMNAAIFSAIADIRNANIGARVVRVGQADSDDVGGKTVGAVGNVNSALELFRAIDRDPELRPFVLRYLEHGR